MRVKKKLGGVISRIRNNRRIRKQKKAIRETAGSAAKAVVSKLNSSGSTPKRPVASVGKGRLLSITERKLESGKTPRLSVGAGRPKPRSLGKVDVSRADEAMINRTRFNNMPAGATGKSYSPPKKKTAAPAKKPKSGRRSVEDLKRLGFETIKRNASQKKKKK